MPETQPTPDQYIEPPPAGWGGMGGPVGTPSDAFGIQPMMRPPATPPPQAPTGPPDEVIQPQGGAQLPMTQVSASAGGAPALRDQVKQMWIDAGATPEAADGIARRIEVESGFNPLAMGDYRGSQPTSFGLYQHHNDRAGKLFAFAKQEGKSPSDPLVQTAFAIHEAKNGGDHVASANWDKIRSDPTGSAFTHFFERPAGTMQQVASQISPDLQAAHDQLVAAGNREREAITSGKSELQRLIDAEPPGSAKRDKLIDEMHSSIAAKEAAWKEKYDHPPVLKPADAFQNFGSIATIVGLIGGLFARRHMTAALGAAGHAMQAINQNNFDQYQQQMKIWETQTRSAAEELHMQHQDLEMLIRDKQLSWDQKQALISNKFKEIGLDREVAAVQHGDAQTWMQTIATMDRAQNQLKNLTGQMAIGNRALAEQNWNQKYYADHPDMAGQPIPLDEQVKRNQYLDQNFPLPGAPHAQAPTAAKGREQDVSAEVKRRDDEFASANPNATPSEKEKAHFDNRTAVEKQMGAATRQPRSASAMATQKFIEENPEATADDLVKFQANQARAVAVERAFGAGPTANRVTTLNTVSDHLVTFEEAAKALETGDVRLLNQLQNRWRIETGDPRPIEFGIVKEMAGREISTAIVGGPGASEDRTAIQGWINEARSPAQLAGAFQRAKQLIAGRLDSLGRQYSGGDSERRKHFDEVMLSPTARKELLASSREHQGAAPSTTPPLPGARLAPDGHWYLPPSTPGGKYQRVDP
jgi:hypothetical protein